MLPTLGILRNDTVLWEHKLYEEPENFDVNIVNMLGYPLLVVNFIKYKKAHILEKAALTDLFWIRELCSAFMDWVKPGPKLHARIAFVFVQRGSPSAQLQRLKTVLKL